MMLMANRSDQNDTEVEQDFEERERKMREVELMLKELRSRNFTGHKKVADKEQTEAEKCTCVPL